MTHPADKHFGKLEIAGDREFMEEFFVGGELPNVGEVMEFICTRRVDNPFVKAENGLRKGHMIFRQNRRAPVELEFKLRRKQK